MRILHSDNLMIRRYGNVKVSTGRKLFNGMIRNNWKVHEYSERDIAKFEAPLGIKPLGFRAANRRFIETFNNFKPDFCFNLLGTALTLALARLSARFLTQFLIENIAPKTKNRLTMTATIVTQMMPKVSPLDCEHSSYFGSVNTK